MLECVPNVSEGRDRRVIDALATASGTALLDVHSDQDHHRAVFTLAGEPQITKAAMRALARAVAVHVSIAAHSGVHPRFGALDVVPFIALSPGSEARAEARQAAREFGAWWSSEFAVPVFFYDGADTAASTLPDTRRDAFDRREPDLGPRVPHPVLGATAIGVRRPLVAINCVLRRADVAVARAVARAVRERDGGLPGVRALPFAIGSDRGERGTRFQVSMNLVDLDRTGVEVACTRVRDLARARGAEVEQVELVGLLPAAELARCTPAFLAWSGLHADQTIEGRAARRDRPLRP